MMSNELNEYERQRLENIRQNQEILKSLNIKGIIPDELKAAPAPKKKSSTASSSISSKRSQATVIPEEFATRRISTRLQKKALGLEGLDEDFVKISDEFGGGSSRIESSVPPKPRRIVGRIPFDPQEGSSQGFLEMTGELKDFTSENEEKHAGHAPFLRPTDFADAIEIQNEHSVVKVMKERIYSIAVHPDPSKLLVAVGGKFGELAFWDATEAGHPSGIRERRLPEPEDFHPKVFQFRPHTGSISNLRYNPNDSNQLITTSYDNIIRCLDLKKGSFEELFNFGEDTGDVITGFDLSPQGCVFYCSDTSGLFRWFDRRQAQPLIAEVQLHEKKVGCVSVAEEKFLATASNDGTIGLWDLRKLRAGQNAAPESLHTLSFRRAVTSVYFNPMDSSKLLSTCYDDHVRVHSNCTNGASDTHRHAEISHNNQTGRWITNFKAVWDPRSSLAVVGNMNRGIDLIDGEEGSISRNITSEYLTAQPAVNGFHPNLDVIASGNASGKIAVWSYPHP